MPRFDTEKEEVDEQELVCILGETYFEHKRLKEALADRRDEFFAEAEASWSQEELAQKTVEVPQDQLADPSSYALRYNPGWLVREVLQDFDSDDKPSDAVVVISEDPVWKPYSAVYSFDTPKVIEEKGREKTVYGYVITKSIVDGSMLLDDDRITVLDPDLYKKITEWANPSLVLAANLSQAVLEAIDWPRQLKAMDVLTAKQRTQVNPYLFEAPKTTRLLVRYAKQDEV